MALLCLDMITLTGLPWLQRFPQRLKHEAGYDALVKAACLESRRSRVRSHSGIQVSKKQTFSARELVTIQYCGSGASVTDS